MDKSTIIIFTLADGTPIKATFYSIDEQDYTTKREQAKQFILNDKKQPILQEILQQKYLFN